MVDRRSFLQSGLTSALVSALAPEASAPLPAEFPARLQDALTQTLDDPKLAARLAPVLLDVGFTWVPPIQPAATFQTIVAYSFGNRPGAPGSANPAPGPTNEALAATVLEAQRRSHATRVYAQWEIASFLPVQPAGYKVVAINPVIAPDHTVTYLSTDGVAQAVVTDIGGDATKLGRVCVIGHHDHAKRCVQTSRAGGMDAWAMDGLTLPATYDPESDQPWTRDREIYLIHDMAAQLMTLRAIRIATLTNRA